MDVPKLWKVKQVNMRKVMLIALVYAILITSSCYCIPPDPTILNKISTELGVNRNWKEVKAEFYKRLDPGQTREITHEFIASVGKYEIIFSDYESELFVWHNNDKAYREEIWFEDINLRKGLGGSFMLLFDSEGKLLEVQELDNP